ncbi:hypothetical protein C0J52_15492 [Blattella germanica]|nr:hypothetical protein C0J52_15492 [Blattella germanica]
MVVMRRSSKTAKAGEWCLLFVWCAAGAPGVKTLTFRKDFCSNHVTFKESRRTRTEDRCKPNLSSGTKTLRY